MLFGNFDHLPTERLGGLERSRDELVERDALRAQISPFRYAPASPSRSQYLVP
jgi:hypothetical protein